MLVAEGVRTVGDLEVMAYLEQGGPVVDSRTHNFYVNSTIPGARNIPYPEVIARLDELPGEQPAIFFCNGPQCGQSPTAIRALLEAGYPREKILYYRGGLHDWLTLGLPVEPGENTK
jgi:rhodanese-related sulfurtransferase